jgi:hypothetical protein
MRPGLQWNRFFCGFAFSSLLSLLLVEDNSLIVPLPAAGGGRRSFP